jgi:isoleucyl-tRNA synthetase
MTSTKPASRDWSATLFLPKTEFPMKAGLPQLEPKLLERWARLGMYRRLRQAAKGRSKFILHDGPPYANGNIHIGTALNKILKDMVTRSQQMLGFDSNYVPGWDCHGLPIEWQIEQEYRAKGMRKEDVPVLQLIDECRAFAQKWIAIQRAELKRLGVEGDWDHPYTTMAFAAEAQIARELMKFAASGQLYRGSKPVMWSVVEKTALAEAEIEYHDTTSDMVWVKFPVVPKAVGAQPAVLEGASVVIWTTTPWTLPGNRAISFSNRIDYGLYEVTKAPEGNWAKAGDRLILAKKLAEAVMKAAKVDAFELTGDVDPIGLTCAHPLRGRGYDFDVPLLDGDHVTDEDGTGFVHTAPGHGRDDFEIWMANQAKLAARGIDTAIPFTVDADGAFTREAPGFTGKRVLTDKGEKGDANEAVIKALVEANALIARGRLKHQYPHSWRSKKPVIFRNTPQWFIAMDRPIGAANLPLSPASRASPLPARGEREQGREAIEGHTLRQLALRAIAETKWVPATGQNRITGMIEAKPDWVLSRQRAWACRSRSLSRTMPTAPTRSCRTTRSTSASLRRWRRRASAPGTSPAPPSASSATITARRNGRRSTTSATCGSTPPPRMPSPWRTPSTSPSSPASGASATAAPTPSCIWKAPTSTAAGSIPRCWRAAARAAAPPMTSCSRTASCSTRRGRRCRSR